MPATKNAHDWHCQDHDIYGWKGEECRLCPKAPSEADALRAELGRVVDLCRQLYEAERDKNQQNWTAAIRALEKIGADMTANGEVRGASVTAQPACEASSAEGATSTVSLGTQGD